MTINTQYAFAYPKPVAVITNYSRDNLEGRIDISRANGKPTGSFELLYPNDRITGDVSAVKLTFAPYASSHSEGNVYVIDYTPPTFFGKIVDDTIDMFMNFLNNVEYLTTGTSRSSEDPSQNVSAVNLTPQPGFDVTLLHGQKVTFSWHEPDNKTFSIKDDKGKKIFQKNISGLTSTEIDLKNIKLQAGKQYFWSVDGDSQKFKITMLDEKSETEILSTLNAIDSENIAENERLFKKVAYVQLISDLYPQQFDFYWLSAQWLLDFKATTTEEDNHKQFFLGKCLSDLKSKMSTH